MLTAPVFIHNTLFDLYVMSAHQFVADTQTNLVLRKQSWLMDKFYLPEHRELVTRILMKSRCCTCLFTQQKGTGVNTYASAVNGSTTFLLKQAMDESHYRTVGNTCARVNSLLFIFNQFGHIFMEHQNCHYRRLFFQALLKLHVFIECMNPGKINPGGIQCTCANAKTEPCQARFFEQQFAWLLQRLSDMSTSPHYTALYTILTQRLCPDMAVAVLDFMFPTPLVNVRNVFKLKTGDTVCSQ
jgi:hypothetical protein